MLGHLEFEFNRGSRQTEPTYFRACSIASFHIWMDVALVEILVVSEYMDVFMNFSRLPLVRAVELSINFISGKKQSLRRCIR